MLAETSEAAIAASPVTVICVGDYDDTRGVLERDPTALSGRTIIQLTSAAGTDAPSLADWAIAQGADYLDGEIMAYPSEIGGATTLLLLAGDDRAWQTCEPILRTLAGSTRYLGDNFRLPSMLNIALIAPMMGMIAGVIHAALECEKIDFPVAEYTELLTELLPVANHQTLYLATTIAQNNFSDTQAALRTYAAPVSAWIEQCKEQGVNTEFPTLIDGWLQRAMDAGYGDEEISAIIKVLR